MRGSDLLGMIDDARKRDKEEPEERYVTCPGCRWRFKEGSLGAAYVQAQSICERCQERATEEDQL